MKIYREKKNFKYHEIDFPKTKSNAAYHLMCYKKFVVLKAKYKEEYEMMFQNENISPSTSDLMNNSEESAKVADSNLIEQQDMDVEVPSESTSSKEPCIFCGAIRKRASGKILEKSLCTSQEIINKTKEHAKILGDEELLKKLNKLSDSYIYHRNCKAKFNSIYERSIKEEKPESEWHIMRQCHKKTFDVFQEIIDKEIIEKEKIYFLSDLLWRYKMLFLEVNSTCSIDDIESYTANKLQEKILNFHGKNITISSYPSYNIKRIVFKKGIDIDKNIHQSVVHFNSEKCRFENVAYEIRNSVKSSVATTNEINLNSIVEGDCHIPELLFEFVSNMIQGPDVRRKNSNEDLVKIKSICSDIISTITKDHK
ncbi:hypothetical protein PV327_008175 [Microctonus hyperodae]|uniref:Uncharacterized protein n=1 Tax=Microctonus hyperodae TaxID=165561 RepID=A0AA39F2I8_MICHY|nr:hypothetical protein PV327_008175 [Microctonus hyperodae]